MILITGATGTNGQEVVKQLTAAGQKVRAMVRNRAKAARLAGPNVELVEGDFENLASLDAALKGVTAAFFLSTFGNRYREWYANFQSAVLRSGKPRVVKFSAYEASADAPAAIVRLHGETDRMLRDSGLNWTILQPNSFYQNMSFSLATLRSQGAFYLPLGSARQSLVDVRDIGAVAVKALTEPGHEHKTYVLTGPAALTFDEVAQKLSAAAGRPIRYVPVPPSAALDGMLKAGMPSWEAQALTELYGVFAAGKAAGVTSTIRDVLHRPPRTFDEFAKEFVAVLNALA